MLSTCPTKHKTLSSKRVDLSSFNGEQQQTTKWRMLVTCIIGRPHWFHCQQSVQAVNLSVVTSQHPVWWYIMGKNQCKLWLLSCLLLSYGRAASNTKHCVRNLITCCSQLLGSHHELMIIIAGNGNWSKAQYHQQQETPALQQMMATTTWYHHCKRKLNSKIMRIIDVTKWRRHDVTVCRRLKLTTRYRWRMYRTFCIFYDI